ncbi:ABC transporter ATP-binding protein [Paenibacillus sp. FSL R5-0527]|uniref:ABC transporter ATP-binding protein n=1 Tax=Paenibacillus sp. FSL R5-0527 TaxID=2975321 RepID=UPI00097B9BFB|nr:ABC transporter ATP-binding protein [Paenibacillus macerans]
MTALETLEISASHGMFSLREVSVVFPKGKMTAIVGPNGSGKSTLLKTLSRLLRIHGGDIRMDGKPIRQYGSAEFARKLTMLPQSGAFLPNLTVRELVAYGRYPYKRLFRQRMNDEDRRIIEWAMSVTGTSGHADRLFHTLSGGEQQKVRIAMALAQKTDMLLLDEPTTYLDIARQLEILEHLKQINETFGITMVMVLHDLQQAARYCDYLIAMKQGAVVAKGPPQEVLTAAFFRGVYDIEARVKFEENELVVIPLHSISDKEENSR